MSPYSSVYFVVCPIITKLFNYTIINMYNSDDHIKWFGVHLGPSGTGSYRVCGQT